MLSLTLVKPANEFLKMGPTLMFTAAFRNVCLLPWRKFWALSKDFSSVGEEVHERHHVDRWGYEKNSTFMVKQKDLIKVITNNVLEQKTYL